LLFGNKFFARIGENWHTPPNLFCVLAFHNGRENRNKDARINTADDCCTSDKNLVNSSQIIPEFFAGTFALGGLHVGFATYF